MKKFNFMDPAMIMTIVVSLIILAVGVYAFFVTMAAVPHSAAQPGTWSAINNTTKTGNSVFNIVGVVLIIGAIMTIIGLVYSYMKPGGY